MNWDGEESGLAEEPQNAAIRGREMDARQSKWKQQWQKMFTIWGLYYVGGKYMKIIIYIHLS